MASVVRMPSVMANATEGGIQNWLAAEGQTIAVGDPLVEIETEKAVVEYAVEVEGVVGKLLAQVGDNIVVGAPIAVILASGEGKDQIAIALEAAGITLGDEVSVPPMLTQIAEIAPSSAPPSAIFPRAGDRVFASPIVRRLARERGLDLDDLTGTGPDGRIVRRDLAIVAASAHSVTTAIDPGSAAPAESRARFIDIPLNGMRRAIARRLTESTTTVPHFFVTAHLRVDRLMELRREINETSPRKISINDFVLKAVAGALMEVPGANSIWGGDYLRRFAAVDIAIAVAVEGGLVTPVIRAVDTASLSQVSATASELAERARAGSLKQRELEGGAFCVSNLGMYGVDEFSAILNPPQSGILAVGAAKPRPVVSDGQLAVATMMTVTLSADHRVIDGAVAAEWLAAFARQIENPISILI
jgi:pyruvate dehydrogenase E2 component (dihydrolipoamide acetyltransferase)